MSTVSTHILDTARGRPAAGVPVTLETGDGSGWRGLGGSATGADGRIGDLPAFEPPGPVSCRLVFAVGDYLLAQHGRAFFPEITVVFAAGPGEHYHVPLLLSPYGYSVYRGS
ncbi:MAG TPA: hydroxyisourate hydrolase [Streptosporangiaceae bacterium]|nr:hydroxyisourate hydrolase [Streptosporangiaceae bacterium]